jgi:hypothetical protein
MGQSCTPWWVVAWTTRRPIVVRLDVPVERHAHRVTQADAHFVQHTVGYDADGRGDHRLTPGAAVAAS